MTGWNRPAVWRAVVATATVGLIGLAGGRADGADLRPGAWTGGVSGGFLGDTPDGTAFAVNLNAERVLLENFSVGPLLRSEEHTSELQSRRDLVCRLLLEKKKKKDKTKIRPKSLNATSNLT